MSKRRRADVFRADEFISDLRRKIKARTADASRLIARIRSADPDSTNLASLRGQLKSIEVKISHYEQMLKSARTKKEQLASRAKNELEGNTGRHERWMAVQRQTTDELRSQVRLLDELRKVPLSLGGKPQEDNSPHEYDLFISHASEDKDNFVRPLALILIGLGMRVWYDDLSLSVGDSLRKSIDLGLSRSRFGLVVLSSAFFAKNWTQYELNGLVSREMEGTKVILPIWHKVTKDEVMQFSPTLVDKVALNSALLSIDEMAAKLLAAVRGK